MNKVQILPAPPNIPKGLLMDDPDSKKKKKKDSLFSLPVPLVQGLLWALRSDTCLGGEKWPLAPGMS